MKKVMPTLSYANKFNQEIHAFIVNEQLFYKNNRVSYDECFSQNGVNKRALKRGD